MTVYTDYILAEKTEIARDVDIPDSVSDALSPGADSTESGTDGTESGTDGAEGTEEPGTDGTESGTDGTGSTEEPGTDGTESGTDGTDGTEEPGTDGTESGTDGTDGTEEPETDGTEASEPGEDPESETIETISIGEKIKEAPGKFIGIGVIFVVLILFLLLLLRRFLAERNNPGQGSPVQSAGRQESEHMERETRRNMTNAKIEIGKLHHQGMRKYQQDCLSELEVTGGHFAIVADGMGGLADGDKVSQKIVQTMVQDAASMPERHSAVILWEFLSRANREVNKMLGPDNRYKSGSTLVAALAEKGFLHFISVGDSRIYLYRGHRLLQLNREHNYREELLVEAVNGEITFADAAQHPKRKGLTSFIGMGELKHVDGSTSPIPVQKGDIVLLMSDGVYNTLKESEMCAVLETEPDVQAAARRMEQMILNCQKKNQDNFTAILMKL